MELLAVIHPDLHQGTYYTEWIDMAGRHKAIAKVYVGDIGQGGTVDLELQEATDNVGTGAVAIAAKAITQLTAAGNDGDDSCAINLRTEEMNCGANYNHIRARLDVLVASANVCVVLEGNVPRYAPVTQTPWTEVVP